MVVTSVEKRDKGMFALFLDGSYVAMLNGEIILSKGIKNGLEISQSDLRELQLLALRRKARERALYALDRRAYSTNEMFLKLKKDYGEEVATVTIELLCEAGLLNDEDYAKRLTADLINLKGFGLRRVKQELLKRGIDRELIDDTLYELDDDERIQIKEIVERRYKRYLTDKKGYIKVTNLLNRLGYSFSDIKSVLNEYEELDLED